MNGLPGKLTVRHLKMAEERGDNYIIYKKRNYSLKELYDGAGISRTKPKPPVSKDIHGSKIDNSDGERAEPSSDPRKGTAPSRS